MVASLRGATDSDHPAGLVVIRDITGAFIPSVPRLQDRASLCPPLLASAHP